MARSARPVFYFSLRSPYSWMAHHDLVTTHPAVADRLEWRPFWEPDRASEALLAAAGGRFVYTPMSREKHLYILQDVRRLSLARGLRVAWPLDRAPRWEVPHLAYLAADRLGAGRVFVAAAYRARWEEGRDICDPATMLTIGDEIGVDGTLLAAAADDPGLAGRATEALLAIDRDSVFGVPFFVLGRERFWGIDRLPAFLDLVAGGSDPAPPPPVLVPSVPVGRSIEDGHAGGCG